MSPSVCCVDEPISWLRLERYHAGDADAAERARIAAHVAACPACAACLASIEKDDAVALPPLPLPRTQPLGGVRYLRFGGLVAGGLALAAAALLGVGGGWHAGRPLEQATSRVKGNEIAFTLVRDDDERIAEAGGIYRDGDRFKAIVTCPPGASLSFDLVVFDAQGASFPLSPATGFACGNDAPLPGAFRLTGSEEETVCLVWSEGGRPDRSRMAAGREGFGERETCKTLHAGASSSPIPPTP